MLRKLGLALAAILGIVIVVVLGAFGYAQTPMGREQLAAFVARQLSGPGQQAEVEGLSGLLPFDVRLGSFRLSDEEGAWLEVEDARLELAPGALLQGEVAIRQVGARRVALNRLPAGPPEPEPEEPFSLPRLPEIPESLPHVAVDRLFVGALELGQPVLGEAAIFALDGSATTGPGGGRAQVRLDARRTDEPTARLNLAAVLDLASESLNLDLQGSETGGLLAAATGHPEAGTLRVSLVGQGPLSGWKGRLAVDAERLAKVNLAVDLAYADQRRIAVTGTLDAAPGALPAEIAEVVGTHAELSLRAEETAPRRFVLRDLGLKAAGLSLTGSGSVDLAADTVDGSATLEVPDLARFAGLAGIPLDGAAVLRLGASGAARQPELRLGLEATDLAAANAVVGRLGATFDVAFTAPLGKGPVGVRVAGTVEATGLALNGRTLGEDGRLSLELDGELPREGAATVRKLALRSSLFELAGRASVDRGSLAGTAHLDATVPNLAAVARSLGVDLAAAPLPEGAFRLGADATIAERAARVEVTLDGDGSRLSGLPPGVQELVGPAPTLQARAVVEPDRAAAFESLVVAGTGVRLEGEPRYGFADQSLGGELRLSVPELAPLEPLVGQPVAGRLELRTGLGGTVPAPAVTLDATVDELAVAGQAFERVALAADASGPVDALRGSARLTAAQGRQELTLATGYQLSGQRLALSGLSLEAPGTRLAGDLEVNLDAPLARGGVSGQVRELAALEPWIGQRAAGEVALDLRLTTRAGRQGATLAVDASDIAGGFGALRSARLDATVRDAFGTAAVDARLGAQGFTAPDLAVDRATVGVAGPLSRLDATASAAGSQAGRPFTVDAAAGLDVLGPRKTVRVANLSGAFAGEPFRLAQPATVVLEENGAIEVDRLDARLGPARVQGNVALGAQRVRGELTLDELPLSAFEPFGGPALAGTGRARLDLSGTRRAPQLALDVDLQGVAPDPGAMVKADAALDATLRRDRLEAELRVTGLGPTPVVARAGLPVTFGLDPVAFALDQAAPLTGGVDGPVELARVAQLAALDGVQLAGTLQLAVDVSGALGRPRLGGTLQLADGSVQELTSGVILRDVRLEARASGDRLAIQELSARDPAGGTLTGRGGLAIPVGGGLTYDLALDAANARVMDNQLGVVVLSGDLGVAGDLGRAAAKGTITVDRADIAIPDSTGPSIPVMQVTEINDQGAPSTDPAETGPPFELGFDVAIEVPARLFVRGRGLQSEWGGSLRIEGDLAEPRILGNLEVRRGFFDLLDRRFEIVRGELAFVGSQPPVPMVDLEARAQTQEIEVTVGLQGPAADPRLTLSSTPSLPQDEILSRLLFGTSVARISPMQGIRLAAAVQELQGGGTVSNVLSSMRRAIGVDTLDVGGGNTTEDTTVSAGKYVSDNVFVEVEQGVAGGAGSTARVQVELTPNLSVSTEVNAQSQTGVGLQWRYDY